MLQELEFTLPAIALILLAHEAGHIVALLGLGIEVEGLSIGLPFRPRLFRFRVRGFTIQVTPWLVSVGPIVRNAIFRKAPSWKKVAVVAYGAVAQVVFGLFIAVLVFGPSEGLQISVGFIRSFSDFTTHGAIAEMLGLFDQDRMLTGDVLAAVLAELNKPLLHDLAPRIETASRWERTIMGGMLLNLELVVVNLLPLPLFDGGWLILLVVGSWLERIRKRDQPA
ncbi:site-2 protease family protein [Patescibacteria group bacterium]|nr:site-2 protease family protein [Patescibacteria group bacterium]